MSTPVVWLSYRPEIAHRGYWDQALLEDLLATSALEPEHLTEVPKSGGAIVVVPGEHHAKARHVARLREEIGRLDWCVLVVTCNEPGTFPYTSFLDLPRVVVWLQAPRTRDVELLSGQNFDRTRFLPEGYTPKTRAFARVRLLDPKTTDLCFAGQVTHDRRAWCARAVEEAGGELTATDGFARGLPPDAYAAQLARTRLAACPAGNEIQDTFRVWEALEFGALPLVDDFTSAGDTGYWDVLNPPFPRVNAWDRLPEISRRELAAWPLNVNRALAWWQLQKNFIRCELEHDVEELSGCELSRPPATVVVTTSPIPSHPSLKVITETFDSLPPGWPVIVAIDGVRSEQAHYSEAYAEYTRRLLQLCNVRGYLPVLSESHQHQANMTRRALRHVKTRAVLFVEHDTPLEGSIPWSALCDVLDTRAVDLVRFHHEVEIPKEHRHLMIGEPLDVHGVPLQRTAQWSQRPHLARTGFYNRILGAYFGTKSRTMIEDVMHGVCDQEYRERSWDKFRLAIYHPSGSIKRSGHLDGRAGDVKFDMLYDYDGDVPEGAPQRTCLA